MSPEISTAIMLIGVGMITVFVALLLVVIVGKLIVSFVNRYVPEEKAFAGSANQIAPAKIAAITSAIEAFTNGKGTITNIKKI